MSITQPSENYGKRASGSSSIGPRISFMASVIAAAAAIAVGLIPSQLLMPAVSTLLFVLAMVFALVAWIRCSTDEYGVTYWDVAGALILVGICTAALIEPETLSRLVAEAPTHN